MSIEELEKEVQKLEFGIDGKYCRPMGTVGLPKQNKRDHLGVRQIE